MYSEQIHRYVISYILYTTLYALMGCFLSIVSAKISLSLRGPTLCTSLRTVILKDVRNICGLYTHGNSNPQERRKYLWSKRLYTFEDSNSQEYRKYLRSNILHVRENKNPQIIINICSPSLGIPLKMSEIFAV